MTTQNDDLLKVVRKQQAQIDKQKTEIDELLKQNGQLINKIGTTANTGGATSGGAVNNHRGRYRVNRNTNATATATPTPAAMTWYQTLGLAPTTEPTISQSAPFSPFVCMQQLIVGSWIRTKAKDLIIGQVCSNETRRGQVSIRQQQSQHQQK